MGSWPGYEPGMLRYLFLWEEVNYSQTEISISYVTKQADKLLYYPLVTSLITQGSGFTARASVMRVATTSKER